MPYARVRGSGLFHFPSAGQATAYFYGYSRLLELRTQTEVALGKNFSL